MIASKIIAAFAMWISASGIFGTAAYASNDPVPLWVYHSSTVYGNMGQCAITLSFDSQTQSVRGLNLKLVAVGKDGAVRARGDVTVPDFGESEATRYVDAHWGHAALCEDNLQLRIEQARGKVLGSSFDLIARQLLEVDEFKPMPISIGKGVPTTKKPAKK